MGREKQKGKLKVVSTNSLIPKGGSVRSRILRMCNTDTIAAAARLDDHWYEAASNKETWKDRIREHAQLAPCDPSFDLITPGMYVKLLRFSYKDFATLQPMTHGNLDDFIPALGMLAGTPQTVYTIQFPALHILLRLPEVLRLAPADVPVKEGYAVFAPWVMLITAVVRWYKVLGCPGAMVPWLLSTYQWVASCSILNSTDFHKIMLAAPMAILTPTSGVPSALGGGTNKVVPLPPLPSSLAEKLLEITHLVAQKFLKPNFTSTYIPDEKFVDPLGSKSGVGKKLTSASASGVASSPTNSPGEAKESRSEDNERSRLCVGTMEVLFAMIAEQPRTEETVALGEAAVRSEKQRERIQVRMEALRSLGMLNSGGKIGSAIGTAGKKGAHENTPAVTKLAIPVQHPELHTPEDHLDFERKQEENREKAIKYIAEECLNIGTMNSAKLKLLGDDDARLVMSVYYHIVRRNPELKAECMSHIAERWGTSGLEEFVAAGRRVEYLCAIQAEIQTTIQHDPNR